MAFLDHHKKLETNVTLLAVFAFLAVTVGGLVQIVPLFYLDNTIEEVDGMRPYTPLELGRMPSTFSIVLSIYMSGAIWMMPPIDTTTRMPIVRSSEWRSRIP